MKKLFTRAVTGSAFVGLIILALVLNSHLCFIGLFSLMSILSLAEFYRLTNKKEKKITSLLDIAGGLILFLSLYALMTSPQFEIITVVPYLIYLVARFVVQLYTKEENPLINWAFSLMGQVYVALPIALLNVVAFKYGFNILLALFIFIWINDTGAFCVGSTIGKNRLFERISPKKSWEGFFGGLAFCIVAATLFALCFPAYFSGLSLAQWIGLGIVTSIFATWGDLCESLIKRTLGVKDSGKLLPGHGGMLDRIDSLLLVIPVALLYLILIKSI